MQHLGWEAQSQDRQSETEHPFEAPVLGDSLSQQHLYWQRNVYHLKSAVSSKVERIDIA